MFIKSVLLPSALLTAAILIACSFDGDEDSSEDSTVQPTSDAVTESQVKVNYVKMAYAAYSDSLTAALVLQTAVNGLLAQPTESNLRAAREAYKAARIPYQQSEIMRWDTDITLGTNTGDEGIESVDAWEGQVNAWPLNEGFIDYAQGQFDNNLIAGTEAITKELLIGQNGADDNEANVATGVHAIEFLLWGEDTNGTDAGAGMRAATDYDIANCTNGNCDRRRTYLSVVTDLLVEDLTAMVAEWSTEAESQTGTLANNFLNSDNALAYIVAAMKAMATDELASARMGIALETGETEEEHDCFSDLSHVAIFYNFKGVQNAFYGAYGDVSGASIADLVRQKDAATFQALDSALDDIEENMQTVLDAGERETNTVRFDQIVGQGETEPERIAAQTAVNSLIGLSAQFNNVRELLSLQELGTDGGGDGD